MHDEFSNVLILSFLFYETFSFFFIFTFYENTFENFFIYPTGIIDSLLSSYYLYVCFIRYCFIFSCWIMHDEFSNVLILSFLFYETFLFFFIFTFYENTFENFLFYPTGIIDSLLFAYSLNICFNRYCFIFSCWIMHDEFWRTFYFIL